MRSKLLTYFGVWLLSFITYLIFSGSVRMYDIVTGLLVSVVISYLLAGFVVREGRKLGEVKRLAYLVKYFIYYMLVAEVRAHSDVIKRILHPKMPINPGIVRVPYGVSSDYAMTLIANSITNTPGTVVVDVSKDRKELYVHWIDVKAVEPEKSREFISKTFEEYAKKIFD